MSNKSQLQTNNTDLQFILSTVLGLPTQESCKTGQYVWKKYVTGLLPCTITGTYTYSNATVVLDSPDYDLTQLSASDFVGMVMTTNGYGDVTFTSSTSCTQGSTTKTWTWNASSKTMTFSTHLGSTTTSVSCYNTPKVVSGWVFNSYTVSNNESAYPDGGTQDGYWYKKVVEGVDLMTMLGCTKMTIDKITFATEQYDGTQIPHSHGYAPKYIIMTTSSIPDTPYTVKDEFLVNDKIIGAWYTTGSDAQVYPQDSRTTGVIVNDSYFKIGTTTSKPSYSSYLRYGIGIEYNIICFS